jgi:hypothetical protein
MSAASVDLTTPHHLAVSAKWNGVNANSNGVSAN